MELWKAGLTIDSVWYLFRGIAAEMIGLTYVKLSNERYLWIEKSRDVPCIGPTPVILKICQWREELHAARS